MVSKLVCLQTSPTALCSEISGMNISNYSILQTKWNQQQMSLLIKRKCSPLLPSLFLEILKSFLKTVFRDRNKQFQHSEETRIWQKQNDSWVNVHIHRSIYHPEQWSKSSNSITSSTDRLRKQIIEAENKKQQQ